MADPRDRRATLADSGQWNGVDFVEVVDDAETSLRVHFLNAVDLDVERVTITGGDAIPTVAVTGLAWRPADHTLDVTVAAPGDFSTYTLAVVARSGNLDPHFDRVAFSFKARCPSTLDCETPPPVCAPDDAEAPPIDYLAKDFHSFKQALSDFSARRYPAWQERSEADFGVMFLEALASLADDLSYQQDRIAAEAWLETATERRSLVRLARLVDYEPRPATAARTWLRFLIATPATHAIPSGVGVSALGPDGSTIDFETGDDLDQDTTYPAASAWNAMQPYWWDDGERCLAAGATSMWIEDPGVPLAKDQHVLIDTEGRAGERPLRQRVKLTGVAAKRDPLYGVAVVELTWDRVDQLVRERDLTRTTVAGNLAPATQGRRHTERFAIPRVPGAPPEPRGVARAIARTGPNRTPQYLYPLAHAPLTWIDRGGDAGWKPELQVVEAVSGRAWAWSRTLLEGGTAHRVVTVDPMRYRGLGEVEDAADYDGAGGETLRFGDGTFGAIPPDGLIFDVTYRAGAGTAGNVAAGTLTRVDPAHRFAAEVLAVDNPLAAAGGQDEEPADRIRELAPQRFRAKLERAVRAEDYDRSAMELPWVQRAGTAFRYTGSWLSVCTTVDPRASEAMSTAQQLELLRLLDRRRLAGYEVHALPPRFASLDLEITVCARPDAFRGDVKRGVLTALDRAHFFHPDRFSFGLALERSALEDAVQDVPGVDGVTAVRYRRRGVLRDFVVMPDAVEVGGDEIVRVDNDPSRPERGSLRVDVMGGK